MTYPSGSGVITNNYGPSTPNPGTVGQATPFPSPGAASNQTPPTTTPATYNFANGIMSTQEEINGANGEVLPQQGTNATTNVSSVCLSGYSPTGWNSCSFVQTSGSWQSK